MMLRTLMNCILEAELTAIACARATAARSHRTFDYFLPVSVCVFFYLGPTSVCIGQTGYSESEVRFMHIDPTGRRALFASGDGTAIPKTLCVLDLTSGKANVVFATDHTIAGAWPLGWSDKNRIAGLVKVRSKAATGKSTVDFRVIQGDADRIGVFTELSLSNLLNNDKRFKGSAVLPGDFTLGHHGRLFFSVRTSGGQNERVCSLDLRTASIRVEGSLPESWTTWHVLLPVTRGTAYVTVCAKKYPWAVSSENAIFELRIDEARRKVVDLGTGVGFYSSSIVPRRIAYSKVLASGRWSYHLVELVGSRTANPKRIGESKLSQTLLNDRGSQALLWQDIIASKEPLMMFFLADSGRRAIEVTEPIDGFVGAAFVKEWLYVANRGKLRRIDAKSGKTVKKIPISIRGFVTKASSQRFRVSSGALANTPRANRAPGGTAPLWGDRRAHM